MRSAQDTETTKLHIGKDGTLRIPAHVVSTAQLQAGDEVTVHVKPKQLAVVGSIMVEELLAQFVRDTHCVLANVDESYRMADGLTLDAYLALNDAERDALWQQAIRRRTMPAHASLSGTSRPTTCLLDKNIVRAVFEARVRVQRGQVPLPHQAQAAIMHYRPNGSESRWTKPNPRRHRRSRLAG